MKRFYFKYKDNSGFISVYPLDLGGQLSEIVSNMPQGSMMSIPTLGISLDDFFEKVVGRTMQKDFDNPNLILLNEERSFRGVYITVENPGDTSSNKAINEAERWISSFVDEKPVYAVYPELSMGIPSLEGEHIMAHCQYENGEIFYSMPNGHYKKGISLEEFNREWTNALEEFNRARTNALNANVDDKEKYIVCWVHNQLRKGEMVNEPSELDNYTPFIWVKDNMTPYAQAKRFYEQMRIQVDVYSVSLCKIIESTDYF